MALALKKAMNELTPALVPLKEAIAKFCPGVEVVIDTDSISKADVKYPFESGAEEKTALFNVVEMAKVQAYAPFRTPTSMIFGRINDFAAVKKVLETIKKVVFVFNHDASTSFDQTIVYKLEGDTLTVTQTGDFTKGLCRNANNNLNYNLTKLQNTFIKDIGGDVAFDKEVEQTLKNSPYTGFVNDIQKMLPGTKVTFDWDSFKAITVPSSWDASDKDAFPQTGGIVGVRKVGDSSYLSWGITRPLEEFIKDKDCKEAVAACKEFKIIAKHEAGVEPTQGVEFKADGATLNITLRGDYSAINRGHFKGDWKQKDQVDKLMNAF